MTLGELRSLVRTRLNRTDCDDTLADTFIEEGVSRIQRELRAPMMERLFYIDPEGPASSFLLPVDYLEGFEVLVGGASLRRVSFRELTRMSTAGPPAAYARFGGQYFLRGAASVGQRIELLYYGEFTPIPDDASTNELLTSAPYLALYAALRPAGVHFQHEQSDIWEGEFQRELVTAQRQSVDDEMNGGPLAVSSLYYDPGM